MQPQEANTFTVTDTRIASSLVGLGFPYGADVTLQTRTDTLLTQFIFGLQSVRFPALNAASLVRAWRDGSLEARDPMHVFCVAMRAQQCYDAQLRCHHDGTVMRLVTCANGQGTRYAAGQEIASLMLATETITSEDFGLSIACGLVGLPIIRRDKIAHNLHRYTLPRFGHAVLLNGALHVWDAQLLMARAPTLHDPLHLSLEDTQPLHPVCIAYDALHARAVLKNQLGKAKPLLLIDEPGHAIAGNGGAERIQVRQALVDANASGRVMDEVTKHMHAPPIRW